MAYGGEYVNSAHANVIVKQKAVLVTLVGCECYSVCGRTLGVELNSKNDLDELFYCLI